ncbi:MAG: serine hydrolase [Thermomicrobiales bacterium]
MMANQNTDTRSALDSPAFSRRRLTKAGALAALTPVAAGLGAGAALAQEASPVADEPAAPGAPGEVTPERVAEVVAQAPELAASMLDRTGVPGMAVAIVHDDAVVYEGYFGVRELGNEVAVDAETIFLLASVSKPLAATVVSAVVGDGDITWDTTMADLAPGFTLHDAWTTQHVTLADLFAHRAGLRDHAGDVLEDLGFQREDILARLRYLEPAYPFRAGYAYGNFGLTAAAVAVATSQSTTWEDLCQTRLYEPLGMSRSSARLADFLAAPNHATPHVQDGDAWVVAPMQRDPDPQSPAGGMSATAPDLAQWVRLQLGQGAYDGEQLIPTAALDPMHRPQAVSSIPQDIANQRTGFYGLGLNISFTDFGAVQWGHSGAFALGAATSVFMLPGSGFGVLVLTNGAPVGVPEALGISVLELATTGAISRDWLEFAGGFFAAAEEAERYSVVRDWSTPPANAAPPLPDEAYTGAFGNDYYGAVEIAAGADGLVMRIGPVAREFTLEPWDRDTFSWQPVGENALGRSAISFLIGPEGTATGFSDEYLTKHGPGLLSRLA